MDVNDEVHHVEIPNSFHIQARAGLLVAAGVQNTLRLGMRWFGG